MSLLGRKEFKQYRSVHDLGKRVPYTVSSKTEVNSFVLLKDGLRKVKS